MYNYEGLRQTLREVFVWTILRCALLHFSKRAQPLRDAYDGEVTGKKLGPHYKHERASGLDVNRCSKAHINLYTQH